MRRTVDKDARWKMICDAGRVAQPRYTYSIVVHPLYRWRGLRGVLHDARQIDGGAGVDVHIWATD